MVTRIENVEREYLIEGVVVDRSTQRGVRGLHVTAWDRDTDYNDMLGQVVTDADGAFLIGFDSDYFGNAEPDNGPDLFFKVLMDGNEVLNTFSRPQRNTQRGLTRVRLEIDLPRLVPLGEDRISTEQALKAIDWWHASDFRGVFTQGQDKSRTVGKAAWALFGDVLKDFDFEPVRSKSPREKDIVGQTPDAARSALARHKVRVTDVKPLGTLGTRDNAEQLADYPLHLRDGDSVTLYEREGTIAYYTMDAGPSTNPDAEVVARIGEDLQGVKAQMAGMDEMRGEIDGVRTANAEMAARAAEESAQSLAQGAELRLLRTQLAQVQQASANKDVQIAKLQDDLVVVTRAQDALSARLPPLERLNALEQQLNRLTGPVGPVARKAPTKPAAKPVAKKVAGKSGKKPEK